jgi:hypothetical protein
MNGSCFTCLIDLLVARSDPSIANVIHDGVIEEHWVLWYNTNLFTETGTRISLVCWTARKEILPVEADVTNILGVN